MSSKIFSGSADARMGYTRNAANEKLPIATIGATGQVEHKGFYAKAGAGIGTAVILNGEIGKNIPIGDNFEIATYAGADYTVLNHKRTYFKSISDVDGNKGPSWKSNDLKVHGNIQAALKKPWGKIGVGAEAGMQQTEQPELKPGTIDPTIGETRGTKYAGRTQKLYVTPTLNSEFNITKKLQLKLNASLNGGDLGISYTF